MVTLVRPDPSLHAGWLAMARAFGGGHIDGAALGEHPVDELANAATFSAWVDELRAQERGEHVRARWVPSSVRWVVEDGEVVGTIHLRHELNDCLLQKGGHVGYSVRPSARRRGIATRALALLLDEARARGIEQVLVTCDDGNVGSARTIERNGGVLEDVRAGTRRYWITLHHKETPA